MWMRFVFNIYEFYSVTLFSWKFVNSDSEINFISQNFYFVCHWSFYYEGFTVDNLKWEFVCIIFVIVDFFPHRERSFIFLKISETKNMKTYAVECSGLRYITSWIVIQVLTVNNKFVYLCSMHRLSNSTNLFPKKYDVDSWTLGESILISFFYCDVQK